MGAGGLEPTTIGVDVGVSANGARNLIEFVGGIRVDLLEISLHHTADFALAAVDETGGTGMAVDRVKVGKAVIFRDLRWVAPMEVIGFDGVAIRMGAYGAEARVAFQIGWRVRGSRLGDGDREVGQRSVGSSRAMDMDGKFRASSLGLRRIQCAASREFGLKGGLRGFARLLAFQLSCFDRRLQPELFRHARNKGGTPLAR